MGPSNQTAARATERIRTPRTRTLLEPILRVVHDPCELQRVLSALDRTSSREERALPGNTTLDLGVYVLNPVTSQAFVSAIAGHDDLPAVLHDLPPGATPVRTTF